MLLGKLSAILALIFSVQGSPILDKGKGSPIDEGWRNSTLMNQNQLRNEHGLLKRTQHMNTQLPDGNDCELTVSSGSFTQGWHTLDFAHLYHQAGNALTDSIARNGRVQVGLTMSYTDSLGRRHQVDCEVTNTGHAHVSLAGAHENVDQALAAGTTARRRRLDWTYRYIKNHPSCLLWWCSSSLNCCQHIELKLYY